MSLLRRTVVVSSKPEIQQLVQQICREVFVADDLAEALEITERITPDAVIFDQRFAPSHIRQFLNEADKNSINTPVIIIDNCESNINRSSEFFRIGVYDYLCGRHDYHNLKSIAENIKNRSNAVDSTINTSDFYVDDIAASALIVGRSEATQKMLKMLKLIGESQCNPVLIVGETGTGKELAAKAIHKLRHPDQPFVDVNCAALTANLLESELFGHVKGAFTGADRDKIGLLELAGSGSIFLDEISEMPLDLQAKLLRVIQEQTFRKVGGTKNITCRATFIVSSNRNLKDEILSNRFRKDLYYRLTICPINISPLRSPQRKEDVRLLADYFLKKSTICLEKQRKISSLTKFAVEALQKYDWPGNVRELRNVIERAILLENTDKIGLSSIVLDPAKLEQTAENPTSSFKDFSLEKVERELIARALQETGWQKTQAAALLGITRATLYAKVKQYNIERKLSSLKNQPNKPAKSPQSQPVAAL